MQKMMGFFVLHLSENPAWHFGTERFEIVVNGNGSIPQYIFWDQNTPTLKYFLHLDQIYEATKNEKDDLVPYPISIIKTGSLNWFWTNVTQTQTEGSIFGFNFNVTVRNVSVNNVSRFDRLQLRHQIEVTNDTLNGVIIIEMDNYRWLSPAPNAFFVLLFRFAMSEKMSENQGKQASSTEVTLNYARFTLNSTATSLPDAGKVDVELIMMKTNDNATDDGMWTVYKHFPNSFIHGVSFGINKGAPLGLILGLAFLVVTLTSILIVIIVWFTRRQRSFIIS
jgi:hypothetical protein